MDSKIKISLNAFQLKMISLVFYIVGRVMIQIALGNYTGDGFTGKGYMFLFKAGYVVLYIAVPIICFLTVLGVLKTRDLKRYLFRIFTAALVTELAFDFAIFGTSAFKGKDGFFSAPAFTANSNFYFTLLIGTACIAFMERFVKRRFTSGSAPFVLLNIFATLAASGLTLLIKSEQSAIGILTMVAIYLFYGNLFLSLVSVAVLQILALGSANASIMFAPIIGMLFVITYNGKEGYKKNWVRLLTYVAYPICYVIMILLLKWG